MTAEQLAGLREQIDAARAELHDAQRVEALLHEGHDHSGVPAGAWCDLCGPVAVARGVIERDLAARRVEAWVAVLDRLRAEGRRLGLFE